MKKFRFSDFDFKTEMAIITVSLSVSFMLLFFSPLEIFFGNTSDFNIDFKHLIFPLLAFSLMITAISVLILNVAYFLQKALYTVLIDLLSGFLIAGYIQQLFLNGKMISLTGDNVRYASFSPTVTFNLIIFILITLFPLIISSLKTVLPEKKLFKHNGNVAIIYVSVIITIMQLTGLTLNLAKTDWDKVNKENGTRLSYSNLMNLSQDENIVVFLVDRLDGEWFDKVLEEYSDFSDKLIGFTYYRNNISHYTNTFPSVPNMLTAKQYHGETVNDYISIIWDGDSVPDTLAANGWRTTLVIDNRTTYHKTEHISKFCDNLKKIDTSDIKYNYTGADGIIPTMTWLSLSRVLPYAAKDICMPNIPEYISDEFMIVINDSEDLVPLSTSDKVDMKLYNYLNEHGLKCDAGKTFSFIHLNGAHDISKSLSELYPHEQEANRSTTIRGDFEILFKYMEQMKELGIYDNSVILILGDHGDTPSSIYVQHKNEIESPITTSLLIKPKNSASEPLKINNEAPLSNDNFPASILEFAGIDHKKYGNSYNDIINKGLTPERYLQAIYWMGSNNLVYKALYKILGNARNFDNWEVVQEHK